jgi:serine/threonine protein kinase
MSHCPYCAFLLDASAVICSSCGANIRVQTWALPSQIMLSKYRLERVLGQGGFGITYLAQDPLLNRAVAIKELFPEGSSRQGLKVIPTPSLGLQGFLETKTRFLAEAQALAQFSHAGIVRVFDVFEQNATAYLVMEALAGETLGQRLIRGKLLPLEVQRLGLMICEALSVVHSAGLLHRDIKPDNVFLSNNRVVLLDFGSARAFAVDAVQSHTRLVTPGYAAPEQYASQAKFAAYTDIYGLAATLYHALEGVMPPSATDRMLGSSLRISNQSALMSAILQGLEIVAAKRPASAEAFAALLEKKVVSAPQPVQVVSSNPAFQQVVNPVPLVRPTLAQVAASVQSNQSLAQVAQMTPIFTPTYAPVKQNSNSWVMIVVTILIILVVFWFGLFLLPRDYQISSQQSNSAVLPPMTENEFVSDYSAVVYNAFQTLSRKEKIRVLKNKSFDCFNKTFLTQSALTWNTPPPAVKFCLVLLEKTEEIRVVVRSTNGFVSVNGN